jgi:hypothetical protein
MMTLTNHSSRRLKNLLRQALLTNDNPKDRMKEGQQQTINNNKK